MLTHRQKIMELLAGGRFTLNEISARVHLPAKDVLQHLGHVQKSIRPPSRFLMEPAECLHCGFVFEERRKLSPPSKCPKCRSSHIQDPKYGVEEVKRKLKTKISLAFVIISGMLLLGRMDPIYAAERVLHENKKTAEGAGADQGERLAEKTYGELYVRGAVLYATGDYEKALPFMQAATEKKPEDEKAWYILGYCYRELDRPHAALIAFKRAIKINPAFKEAHRDMGFAYKKMGLKRDAIEAFKKVLRLEPQDAEAHYEMGRLYADLNRHQAAVTAFKKVISFKPEYVAPHYDLGISYRKLGLFEREIETYKRIIEIQPDDAFAHFNLGATCSKLGRFDEAVRALTEATRLRSDYIIAHYVLGLTYLLEGDKENAREQYRILESLDREKAEALWREINR